MKLLKSAYHLFTSVLVLTLINTTVFSQTYNIPFAEKQPAWVFPLWFTNGDGQKDTFYLAYDLEASSATEDSLFGEYPSSSDESLFYVETDFKWKVIATDKLTYAIGISISNIVYPFTIAYDSKVLYSDSLPGPSSSLVPKVWSSLEGSGVIEDCPNFDFDGFIVILSDVSIDGYPGSVFDEDFCTKDSIVIVDGVATMSLALREWNPPTAVQFSSNPYDDPVKVWLSENSLFIYHNSSVATELRLFNLSGILLHQVELPPGTYTLSEHLASWLGDFHGLLLLSASNDEMSFTRKVLIP